MDEKNNVEKNSRWNSDAFISMKECECAYNLYIPIIVSIYLFDLCACILLQPQQFVAIGNVCAMFLLR